MDYARSGYQMAGNFSFGIYNLGQAPGLKQIIEPETIRIKSEQFKPKPHPPMSMPRLNLFKIELLIKF